MRKSCYGMPVGDFRAWVTTANYILKFEETGEEGQICLKAFVKALSVAVFESKRPMLIRFTKSGLSQHELDLFRMCFSAHIMYEDADEVMFAGRTMCSSSPIVTWRRHYPSALK